MLRASRSAARTSSSTRAIQEFERPLLNHLAVLVDSAEDHKRDAEEAGIEVERFVDAANTLAVFLWGPDRVAHRVRRAQAQFSLT